MMRFPKFLGVVPQTLNIVLTDNMDPIFHVPICHQKKWKGHCNDFQGLIVFLHCIN